MSVAEMDPFGVSSGLIDDEDITIVDAQYGFDERYNNGQSLLLKLKVMTSDGEEHEVSLPCGSDWTTVDGGQTAVHPKGRKRFNKNSGIGLILDRCFAPKEQGGFGLVQLWRERDPVNGPLNARTWIGLRFHLKRENINYGGEIGAKERPVFTAFLGVANTGVPGAGVLGPVPTVQGHVAPGAMVGVAAAVPGVGNAPAGAVPGYQAPAMTVPPAPAAMGTAGAAPAPAAPAANPAPMAGDPNLLRALEELAKSAPSYEIFQQQAITQFQAQLFAAGNEAILSQVMDPNAIFGRVRAAATA